MYSFMKKTPHRQHKVLIFATENQLYISCAIKSNGYKPRFSNHANIHDKLRVPFDCARFLFRYFALHCKEYNAFLPHVNAQD